MDLSELLTARQSVRSYADTPVEKDKIRQLVESVRLAPSASNAQPWKLIIVDEPELRGAVAQATFSPAISFNRFVPQAPVIAVLTIEKTRTITQIGGWLKAREYPLIDIGIAAEHLCLQATDLGLGTCMIGWFDEPKIKKLLGIPRGTRVGLLVTIGYASDGYPLRPKNRKTVEEMAGYNRYKPATD
jgi:nitroreductase